MLKSQFQGEDLEVELKVPPYIDHIDGDRVRLTQVFTNILTNSIKFTGPGGKVSVEISAIEEDLTVTVTDTGEGIPSDVLPHVFEKFVQAAPGTSKGGLGLGLSLTRSLVELHRGNVEARSDGIGAGSTFVVTLPRAENAMSADHQV